VSGIDDLAISHTRNCDDRHIEGLEKGDGGTTEQPVSCDAQNNEDQQETDSNEQAFAQGHITAPFVDQISDQVAPAGLMAGTQTHSIVAMIVLVEEQIVLPVWILLEFFVRSRLKGPHAI